MKARERVAAFLDRLAARLRKSAAPVWRCSRCNGMDLTWKAFVTPNDGNAIEWLADDPDDVWCEDCEAWGYGCSIEGGAR